MSQKYINIFKGSSILTTRIKSLLEEQGIIGIIKDEMEFGRLVGFGAPINSSQLFVLESDFNQAKSIVKSFEEEIES